MRDGIKNITKGNTEIVAEKLQNLTNANIFKVESIKEYPYNYQECCDVAKEELNKKERPELKKYLKDIDNYDVIYIGSPIWWGTMPMPLFSALEKLNWQGKIVKPFTTHEGSGLGNVMSDLTKVCPGAEINNGLAIRGSDAEESEEMLKSWI